MENKGYVIYDNHNVDYKEWFEEFKSYCEDNDIDFSNYDGFFQAVKGILHHISSGQNLLLASLT